MTCSACSQPRTRPIQAGDRVQTFWNDAAEVLETLPYTGRFPEHFNVVLRVSAPSTRRGWLEVAFDDTVLRRGF